MIYLDDVVEYIYRILEADELEHMVYNISSNRVISQMYQQSGFKVLLNYNMYVWMAQIFILWMVVGYMRDQLHFIRHEDEEDGQFHSLQRDDRDVR